MEDTKFYIVTNKTDDYGNGRTELVQTTPDHAKEYYHHKEVDASDVETLKKYLGVVEFEEESQRSDDDRFYGYE